MTQRHKVFVSYHHENDRQYRRKFENLFAKHFKIMVSKSVDVGDIDPTDNPDRIIQVIRDKYIANASVVVVLVGRQTWQRKYVDWEIRSGLRHTKNNPRCGLLGIRLHNDSYRSPPRLNDNISCRFAKLYPWTDDPDKMQKYIHTAFVDKDKTNPDLSRNLFSKNR